jgi:hypothetical protein
MIHAQLRKENKSGTVRVDGAALVEKVACGVEAVEDNHGLGKHPEVDNVAWRDEGGYFWTGMR